MLVFREVRQQVAGDRLLEGLRDELQALASRSGQQRKDALVSALLRAGELECALTDTASCNLPRTMQVTDLLAAALIHGEDDSVGRALEICRTLEVPAVVQVSPPEGFSYYALHPLDLVDLVHSAVVRRSPSCVIGIRSIGTTLSAIVAAALQDPGDESVERMTVRPTGDYFGRDMRFSPAEIAFLSRHLQRNATFYVVDEGPG